MTKIEHIRVMKTLISFVKYIPSFFKKKKKKHVSGILRDHIIGIIFLEENLNGSTYVRMLQDNITPLINNYSFQSEFH